MRPPQPPPPPPLRVRQQAPPPPQPPPLILREKPPAPPANMGAQTGKNEREKENYFELCFLQNFLASRSSFTCHSCSTSISNHRTPTSIATETS